MAARPWQTCRDAALFPNYFGQTSYYYYHYYCYYCCITTQKLVSTSISKAQINSDNALTCGGIVLRAVKKEVERPGICPGQMTPILKQAAHGP